MSTTNDEAVERFQRRIRSTDEATLYRNLQAGVYGPPGSSRRAVAERALQERFSAAAEALQVATGQGSAQVSDWLDRATRRSSLALRLSIVALGLALLGFARAFGWL